MGKARGVGVHNGRTSILSCTCNAAAVPLRDLESNGRVSDWVTAGIRGLNFQGRSSPGIGAGGFADHLTLTGDDLEHAGIGPAAAP